MREKLLTTREVAQILEMSEREVIELAENGIIPHLKVGGEFLRFRKEDILEVKNKVYKNYNLPPKRTRGRENFREFLYFNDFYIVSILIIAFLLWIILKEILF